MSAITAVRESVSRHPLVSILSSLQSHSTDLHNLSKIHLEKLSPVVMSSGPRPCTSLAGAEVEPAVTSTVGSVPVTGGCDGCILDHTTFHPNRRDAPWLRDLNSCQKINIWKSVRLEHRSYSHSTKSFQSCWWEELSKTQPLDYLMNCPQVCDCVLTLTHIKETRHYTHQSYQRLN